jgi:integrase
MNTAGFKFYLTARGLSPRTITDYAWRIEHLEKLNAITNDGFERFVVKNRARLTNNTINCYLKPLKHFFRYKGFGEFTRLKLMPRNSSPRQSLSLDELSRFLAVTMPHRRIDSCDYQLMFEIMCLAGCRPGELIKLTQNDISYAEGCIYLVDTKTHDTRKIPLPKEIMDRISQIRTERLFKTSPQAYGPAFHYRLKKAGINRPNLTPYSLRHTAITLLLQQPNSNLFDVQNLVGHKSANTTAIYYHSCLERIKRVVQSHPLISNGLTPLERARIITDTIRTFGLDLNPSIETLKDHSIEIKLNIPPPKSGKPHSVA